MEKAELQAALGRIKKTKNKCNIMIGCFAIAMLDYRGPIGDEALDFLRLQIGSDAINGLMLITGFAMAKGKDSEFERLLELSGALKEVSWKWHGWGG